MLVEAIRHGRHAIGLTSDPQQGALAIANISHAREQGAPGRATILPGNPGQLPGLLRQARPILNTNTSAEATRHPAGSVRLILTAPATGTLIALLPRLHAVLAPGGFLLLALDQHDHASPVGLGATIDAAEEASLHYWQHVIALRLAPSRKRTSEPPLWHTDVLAFRKPAAARAARVASQAVSA